MNYSVELWNSYNKVENNLLFHLRGLKDFIYVMKEISKSLSSFSSNLKKLLSINLNITTNESLSQGIENLKKNLILNLASIEAFISNINSEIITPLNTFQETTLKKLNNNYNETLGSEKNYESYLAQIDFSKNKFHSRVKKVEDKILQKEIAKSNNENKELIQNIEKEIKENLDYAKDSEKIYLSYVKYTNRIQEDYIEIKKKNLNQIQSMEIELGKNIKSSLIKFYTYQNTYLKNVFQDSDEKFKTCDSININKDIDNFIKNNRTNDHPPSPLTYSPYVLSLEKKKIEPKIFEDVKTELIKLFPEEKDVSLLKTKVDKDIENFLESIIEGENEKVIWANEKNMKIVSNKNYRRVFLNYLNKLRTNINLVLEDYNYNIIGSLLNECLNYSYKEKDFQCIELIILISTNLYKLNKTSNNPRVFLYTLVKNNSIWKDIKFWENLIKYDINEEMHNQKKYYLYIEENDILQNIRIKDIIKSQLSNNLYNMNLFEVNSSLMFKIINYFSNFYELQPTVVENLNNIVKNYQIKINDSSKKIRITINNNKSNRSSKKNIFKQEEERIINENTIKPVKQDDQKISDCFKELEQKNIYKNEILKKDENVINNETKVDIKNNNINININNNIYIEHSNINRDNNTTSEIINNTQSDRTSTVNIFNEGNFGNILIKETKIDSKIDSDDDIIDESEINYVNNYT